MNFGAIKSLNAYFVGCILYLVGVEPSLSFSYHNSPDNFVINQNHWILYAISAFRVSYIYINHDNAF